MSEPGSAASLNGLRADILGANDGIISVATALIAVLGVFGPGKLRSPPELCSSREHSPWQRASLYQSPLRSTGRMARALWAGALRSTRPSLVSFSFLADGVLPVLAAVSTGHALWVVAISLGLLLLTGLISSKPSQRWRSTALLTAVGIFAFGVSYLGNLALKALGV